MSSTRLWQPSAGALAAAAQCDFGYDGAPLWGIGQCSGGFTNGARTLGEYVDAWFPGVYHIGGYNCRPNTADEDYISIHGVGRAVDIHLHLVHGDSNPLGDAVAEWLLYHAKVLGLQHLIWSRMVWSVSHDGHLRQHVNHYGGPNPHVDHLHAELTRAGGRMETPWFTSGGPGKPPWPPQAGAGPFTWLLALGGLYAGVRWGLPWLQGSTLPGRFPGAGRRTA